MSFNVGGGKKKGGKERTFGITKSDESKRSTVSSVDTSTQGGSSSSQTRVTPSMVPSKKISKDSGNQEISGSPKGESSSFGGKAQDALSYDRVKEVMKPMLKSMMERRHESEFIFDREGVPQESDTSAQRAEREWKDAYNLWGEEREVPLWFIKLIAEIRRKQTRGEKVVEELLHKTNLIKEQGRDIERLREQNDTLRQVRNQTATRSNQAKGSSSKRMDLQEQKEKRGGSLGNRFPMPNPMAQPVENLSVGTEDDKSRHSTQDMEELDSAGGIPMEAQEKDEMDITIEPIQTQDVAVPSLRKPQVFSRERASSSRRENVVISVGYRMTVNGRIKRQRDPNDQTRGPEAYKKRKEKLSREAERARSNSGRPLVSRLDSGSSQDYRGTSVSWRDIREGEDSFPSQRARDLSQLEEEMSGSRRPNPYSSASTGFDRLSKKQRRELERSEREEARDSPHNIYGEVDPVFDRA